MRARSIQQLNPARCVLTPSGKAGSAECLRSPVMGGNSRWNILTDAGLSSILPEVFTSPPDIVSGCLHNEVEKVFQKRNPFIWQFVKARRIFVDDSGDHRAATIKGKMGVGPRSRLATWARVLIVDRLWRS